MSTYLGDFSIDVTVRKIFSTHEATGGNVAPSSAFEAADLRVYEDGSATQITAGITVTSPFDSLTGVHLVEVDTSNAAYSTGHDYECWLVPSDETIDGQTVNVSLFSWSTENRSGLRPTTAGRTLDVTSTGAAGIDWGNVENQGTTVDLSATSTNLVDTTTTNTDMRGTDSALLASSAPTNFGDLSITATTGRVDVASVAGTAQTANDNGADINAILVDTGTTIPAQITGLNDLSAAEVNAEVDTALADYDGPTNTEMVAAFTEIKGATWSSVTDTLEAVRDRGDAAWITATGFSTHSAADVRTEMDANSTQLAAIVADTNELQTDDVPGLIAALNDPTAGAIADAVWDETLTAHATADSAAVYVKDTLTDTGTTLPATLTTIEGKVDTVDTVVDGIQTDLSNSTDGLGALKTLIDAAQGTIDAVEVDTQDIQSRIPTALVSGRMDADIGAISTSTEAADKLELSTESILSGTASGTPTTTSMVSDIAITDDDQFKGRIIIFSTATDAGLVRQATDITSCVASSNTLNFTALTAAPASGDTFIIL